MIRITAGVYRGRQIKSPADKAIRPTTSRVRESVFARIQFELPDARFLDCFSGSGLMGIEAVSRGAGFVMAVEKQLPHVKLIEANYQQLKVSLDRYQVLRYDVDKLLSQPPKEIVAPFQFVYMDPPYGYPAAQALVHNLLQNGWLASEGKILLEQG